MNDTDKYTSYELSKKLAEGKCRIESGYIWKRRKIDITKYDMDTCTSDLEKEFVSTWLCEGERDYYVKGCYVAFDILYDICCKYARNFFGIDKNGNQSYFVVLDGAVKEKENMPIPGYEFHPQEILRLMQQGKKEEAEDYIWKNTVFNPETEGFKESKKDD